MGMGVRVFNAPATLSSNPTVMGNVIGSEHPSNPTFHSFIPQMSKSTAKHGETVGMSHHGTPQSTQSQRTAQQSPA